MNEHFYHLPLTTVSPAAAKAIHIFAEELVSHGSNTRVIFDALAGDPDCAMGQAYTAALFLSQLTCEGQAQAAPRIAVAQELAWMCSAREIQTIDAIAAWARGEDRRAVAILRKIVEVWPHDLVAAKLCQILELGLGDISGMLRTSAMAAAVDERSGYALGLHAFALEQAGHAELALRYARRANELNTGRDPWAQHAIAHALVALEQPVEARAFLRSVAQEWDRCSSFMLTHNWWHLALLELQLNNTSEALALFDERVWGVRKGHTQDQINAISLLARLEMQGVEAGWRWEDIAGHVEDRTGDRISDFLDLHYVYALTRSGRVPAAHSLVAHLQTKPVAGAMAQGISAFVQGDHVGAATAIAPVCRHIGEIGGSNIQRELFDEIFHVSVMCTRREQTTVSREALCVSG